MADDRRTRTGATRGGTDRGDPVEVRDTRPDQDGNRARTTTGRGGSERGAQPLGDLVEDGKTSAAATFSLVFGLSALFTALLAFLAPLALVFGIIGLILGIVGMRKAKEHGVTGKGVAIGGLILSLLGLLLSIALLVGATFFVAQGGLDTLEQRINDLRGEIPSELPEVDVEGGDIDAPDVDVDA